MKSRLVQSIKKSEKLPLTTYQPPAILFAWNIVIDILNLDILNLFQS